MIIYLCLLIPAVAVIALSWIFRKQVTVWERVLVFGVPALAIVISKVVVEKVQTADTEYWNNYAVTATYYEDWDEWITKTCCSTCYDQCRDSQGHTSSCHPHDCNCHDCSYREYHPAYWELDDNGGNTHHITQGLYSYALQLWGGNKTFKDLHRHYYRKDGDAWVTKFDGLFEHIFSVCTKHLYENRVQASTSVFNFRDVPKAAVQQYNLFEYPSDNDKFNYVPILGYPDPPAAEKLQRYNAKLGIVKQVHMMILVFKNQPVDAAFYQEAYWKGGNKNEFILCLGVNDKKEIQWSQVISWTQVQDLKIRAARQAKEMGFNLGMIVDTMATDVSKHFIRKRFRDFSYLSVEPSSTAIIITFIITLILTLGLSIYVVRNEYENDGAEDKK